jgi:3'-phosphoadenosine 5'-phosphosulfate sulfotransferase (PAPS reductase)/FAD synthetase
MLVQRLFDDSKALCAAVLADNGPTVLLSFSGGKDSLSCWIALRRAGFTRIVPFYYYLVPDLEFVEQSLRTYEHHFNTPILRVPNPELLRMLRHHVLQPPERSAILDSMGQLPRYTYEELEEYVRRVTGVGRDTYVAVGSRAADSPIRLANIRRYGSRNPTRRSFLPVYDWRILDVKEALAAEGLQLSPEYRWFGRTFDGLDERFLTALSVHAPRDYERICAWFPMAPLEIFRRQLGGNHAED